MAANMLLGSGKPTTRQINFIQSGLPLTEGDCSSKLDIAVH